MNYMGIITRIHELRGYNYAHSWPTCIQLREFMNYMYTITRIHELHVYKYAHSWTTCIQLRVQVYSVVLPE